MGEIGKPLRVLEVPIQEPERVEPQKTEPQEAPKRKEEEVPA